MGNKSSKPSTATYSQVPTVEIELENSQVPTVETEKDKKQISLKRMQSSLNEINAQIASMQNSTYLTDEQKEAMTTQKAVVEKAIGLLQDQSVTFDAYKAKMGIKGGSKKKSKSRAKKSSANKSRAKKSRAKKSRAKKSSAKKSRAKKSRAKKNRS